MDDEQLALDHLRAARRHAVWLERLAAGTLAFGLTTTAVIVAGALEYLVAGVGAVLVTLLAWGLLRALALLVHLRVDQRLAEGASAEAAPDGTTALA